LWMILALFSGLACGCIAWVSRRWRHSAWLPIYVALLWTGVEYFRCEWFTLRFPWMTAGTAMGPIAVTPWIGVYGVTFLVALLAAHFLVINRSKFSRIIPLPIALLLFIPMKRIPEGPSEKAIPVMAVQSENCDFFTYYERSKESDFRDGVFLWPEYSTFEDTRTALWGKERVSGLAMLTDFAREREATIIFGQSRQQAGKPYNEALTVDGSGIVGSHDKNRPVHFMNDGTPGKTAQPVTTRWGMIGTPICFDNDYTEVPRKMAAAGAQVFLAPSMDAQHWSKRQHWQHSELFRLRAAETGRWYVVCATSGVTQRIGPDGRRYEQLPMMEDGILRTTVYARDEMTFYVRYGWLLPRIALGIAVLWTMGLWIVGRKFPVAPENA
jgi:apolipoprotein N-acyltransferase